MSRLRFYIKPFQSDGTYADDYIECTDDVHSDKLGKINQSLDSSEYQVGILRNSILSLTLRNNLGAYSSAEELRSIFKTKRSDALFKMTWDKADHNLVCGFFKCGEGLLHGEEIVFEGLLNDTSSQTGFYEQVEKFSILGFESILERELFPFSSVNNGDLLSSIIYACLNQSKITDILTVDPANITLGTDIAIDDKTEFEDKTLKEAFGGDSGLLFMSNSVMYIRDKTVFVKPRTAATEIKFSFYGPSSDIGNENIVGEPIYRDGVNRVYNFFTWKDSSEKSQNLTSIETYGYRKLPDGLDLAAITDPAKRIILLDALRDEFSLPKKEIELDTPITYETLNLNLLDRVNIDYPAVYFSADGGLLPRYGQAKYGQSRYPYEISTLTISPSTEFKIMGRGIDLKKGLLQFSLREV